MLVEKLRTGAPVCVLTLTEKHLQFNETCHETVKVYGILSVSMAPDDGLQHGAVDLETWGRWMSYTMGLFSPSFMVADINRLMVGRVALPRL